MAVTNMYGGGASQANPMFIGETVDPYEAGRAHSALNQSKYLFGDGSGGYSTKDQFGLQQSREQQKNAMDMARLPLDYQQNRFNQVFPWLQGQMGQMGAANYNVGGASGTGPHIGAAPIWNNNQIQQQVNSAQATNDRTMATRTKGSQASMAGRGWGANSALSQAMAATFGMQNLMANQDAARDIRWNAAEGNAGHVLKGQTAQEQQYASRMGEDIERRKTMVSSHNALLGALSNLL